MTVYIVLIYKGSNTNIDIVSSVDSAYLKECDAIQRVNEIKETVNKDYLHAYLEGKELPNVDDTDIIAGATYEMFDVK